MKKLLAFTSWLLFALALSSRAYGPEGHKIIGGIADQRLANTPAGTKVSELLDGYTLEEVSIIADTIKQWDKPGIEDPRVQKYFSSHPKIAEQLRNFWKANPPTEDEHSAVPSHHWFHYTDVPLVGNEKYGDAKIGRSRWDIVQMMRYCIQVLEGKIPETNDRKITRPIALILLAHFVGDIHQPLHVGAEYFDVKGNPVNPSQVDGALPDEGGNSLRLRVVGAPPRRHDPKFHGFWDMDSVLANLPVLPDSMPKEERQAEMDAAEKALVIRLAKTEPKDWAANVPAEKLPEVWADDILPLAREAHRRLHYQNVTPKMDHGKMVADGEIVEKEGEYSVPYNHWAPAAVLVEMHKAGWRLADLLTRALQPDEAKQSR
jgi:S1/P1 Nuclease